MDLLPYTDADLTFTEALECDPEVMRELGGPRTRAEVAKVHVRRLNPTGPGDWWLKIVPDPGGPPAGTIGIWPTDHEGARIHEIGWMVLPAFQRRGIASAAVALILERARGEPAIRSLNAFPGASNVPSNALCRKFGFTKLGECDVSFAGRPLQCNHWRLELA